MLWSPIPVGNVFSMWRWQLCVSFNITNEFFCFPDSSGAGVSLVFSGSVAAYHVLFLLWGLGQLFPQTLARWAHATSQAASCTSGCCIKCATVCWSVLYCCGMQTLAQGCSLHSSTYSSLSLQKCLSVLEGFSQVQMHLKVYCTIFSFQSERAKCTLCMNSKDSTTTGYGYRRN